MGTYTLIKGIITINDWYRESRNHRRSIEGTFYVRSSVNYKRNCFKRINCCHTFIATIANGYSEKINQTVRLRAYISHIPYHAIVRKFGIQTPSTNHVGPSAANGACADLWSIAHFYACVCALYTIFLCVSTNLSLCVNVSKIWQMARARLCFFWYICRFFGPFFL